ncbi:hypothetical protein COCVIDRAFT_108749, partial [Bipolaris victoriae FI3]
QVLIAEHVEGGKKGRKVRDSQSVALTNSSASGMLDFGTPLTFNRMSQAGTLRAVHEQMKLSYYKMKPWLLMGNFPEKLPAICLVSIEGKEKEAYGAL